MNRNLELRIGRVQFAFTPHRRLPVFWLQIAAKICSFYHHHLHCLGSKPKYDFDFNCCSFFFWWKCKLLETTEVKADNEDWKCMKCVVFYHRSVEHGEDGSLDEGASAVSRLCCGPSTSRWSSSAPLWSAWAAPRVIISPRARCDHQLSRALIKHPSLCCQLPRISRCSRLA